jgi:outer membrane protein assembly factor BamD
LTRGKPFRLAAAGFRAVALLAAALAMTACSSQIDLYDYLGGGSSSGATTGSTTPAPPPGGTTPAPPAGGAASTSTAAGLQATGKALSPDMAAADDAKPIADLYNKALKNLQEGSYKEASKGFSEVERQHPYSSWATRATLMTAYAQYMRNSYDDATNAAQRFITLHPGHKDAVYAYYLIAMCQYEQIRDIKRDQSITEKALTALDEVGRRFPGTNYARDAEAKAVLARDHLAGKEMEIGRYYTRKKAYLAGINRYKTVLTRYQTTSHTPEALYRLTEAYMALGVRSEAQAAAAVLGHNYPNSDWYKDAYQLLANEGLAPQANSGSWISQLF